MKKQGILNSEIAAVLAKLGHTDTIVIADCGLPIPEGVPRIDLALKLGQPSFLNVLEEVVKDMEVEKMTWANELKDKNPQLHDVVLQNYKETPFSFVSHEELKAQCYKAKAVIRTGECTPYANVILQAGVIF